MQVGEGVKKVAACRLCAAPNFPPIAARSEPSLPVADGWKLRLVERRPRDQQPPLHSVVGEQQSLELCAHPGAAARTSPRALALRLKGPAF